MCYVINQPFSYHNTGFTQFEIKFSWINSFPRYIYFYLLFFYTVIKTLCILNVLFK